MEQFLALEMVRVTEAAAIASARFMGRGERDEADAAATEAMRRTMDETDIAGTIVIGEGERDDAPMLYIGERGGPARPPMSVPGRRHRGGSRSRARTWWRPGRPARSRSSPHRSAAGSRTRRTRTSRSWRRAGRRRASVDITRPAAENCHRIAEALRRKVSDITVSSSTGPGTPTSSRRSAPRARASS